MRTKENGAKYRFTYGYYGIPNNYPDYTAHSGQVVTIVRRMTEEESASPMYVVKAEDGWVGHALSQELRKVSVKTPA